MSKLFRFSVYLFAVFSMLIFTACPSDDDWVDVEPELLQFKKQAGESQSFFIDASGDWTIENNTDFLSLSKSSGNGSMEVSATTTKNNNGGENRGELIIKCGKESATVKAVQEGVDMEFMVQIQDESILEMSNGIAIAAHAGPKVKYFQIALYKSDEFNKLAGPDDVIKDIKVSSGKKLYPNYPDDVSDGKISVTYDDVIAWYKSVKDNTQYTIVAVPYDSNGNTGEISVKPVTTKSSMNQPEVAISDYKVRKDNSGVFHQWTATKNNYCSYYYIYNCVGSKKSNSYVRNDDGLVLAWYIKTHLSDVSDTGYEADFNGDIRHCREIILPQMSGSGAFTVEKESSDAYSEILAWGFSSSNNPSGVVSVVKQSFGNESGTVDRSVSTNQLTVVSDGAAFDFNYGEDVTSIYVNYYTASELSGYSDKDIISDLKTNGLELNSKELDNVVHFSGEAANKQFTICCVGTSQDGTAGSLFKKVITTKSASNQPEVSISDVKATTSNGVAKWSWTVKKNSRCTKYYTLFGENWGELSNSIAAWYVEALINLGDLAPDTENTTWICDRQGSEFDLYIRGANSSGTLSSVINSAHIPTNRGAAPRRESNSKGIINKCNAKDMKEKIKIKVIEL